LKCTSSRGKARSLAAEAWVASPAQAVGVVGIFVAGDDLIDALPQQCQRVVAYAVGMPRIAEASSHLGGQMMALIKRSQRIYREL
jgi:hypothetical protein